MSSRHLLAIATLATAFSGAAFADDGSEYKTDFQSTRTRAEVRAEVIAQAGKRITSFEGSEFTAPMPVAASRVDRAEVRAQAVEAVRLGQIRAGDTSVYQ